jgi:3'(2'), 5'-bisphosphate nucleotidase
MLSQQALDVVTLARQAGDAIMHVYRNMTTEVEIKSDGSPLTQADMASHRIIDAGLRATGLPVLSEENAEIAFSERQQWSRYWLVDPLDGTKEFIARNDEFTVNIALIDQQQPVLGIVYAPALNLLYVGERGAGAFRQRDGGAYEAIQCSSWSPEHGQPLRAVGSRRHGLEKLAALLADLPYTLDNRGSALKICMVAEGDADLYPRMGPTSEWDTAAGQCVVECAGGALLGTDLQPFRYNTRDSLLNPDFLVFGRDHQHWSARLRPVS